MKVFGVFLAIFGLWAASWGIWASYHRKNPIDILGGVMAPLGIGLLVLGMLLVFVPGFLSF